MESKKMKSESVVPGEQKKTEFALGKTNIILIAVAFVVIVVGFLLMLGPGTTPEAYNPDIFSFRRIVSHYDLVRISYIGPRARAHRISAGK